MFYDPEGTGVQGQNHFLQYHKGPCVSNTSNVAPEPIFLTTTLPMMDTKKPGPETLSTS
jgi:hypothetical protein